MNFFKPILCLLLLVSSLLSAQLPIDSIGYHVNEKIPAYVVLSDQQRIEYLDVYKVPVRNDIFDNITEKEKVYQADMLLTHLLNLPQDVTLELQQTNLDEDNNFHVSFYQYYKGIKVDGARYNVHYKGDLVETVNGDFRTVNNNISTKPSITEKMALQYALDEVGAKSYMWEDPDKEQWIKVE